MLTNPCQPRSPEPPGGSGARHRHAVERHQVLGVGGDRHPLLDAQARGVGWDHEQVDVGVAVAGAGQHDEQVGCRRERHVRLRAVEHEAVAVGPGCQLHAAGLVAAARLQPPHGGDGVARRYAAQQLVLLGGGAGFHDGTRGQHAAHEVGERRQGAPQLLVEHHPVDEAHARAALALGDHQPAQSQLSEAPPQVAGDAVGVVLQFAHPFQRGELAAQAPHHVAQHVLFVGEFEVQHQSLPDPQRRGTPHRPVGASRRVTPRGLATGFRHSAARIRASSRRRGGATDCLRSSWAEPLGRFRWCMSGPRRA